MNTQNTENIAEIPKGFLLTQEKFEKIMAVHLEQCQCLTEEEVIDIFKVKEIRPEKAGELWVFESRAIWVTFTKDEDQFKISKEKRLYFKHTGTGNSVDLEEWSLAIDIIHGKNGWERIYPPVEDDSIERIEIEGVRWEKASFHDNLPYPIADTSKYFQNPFKNLVGKTPMKIILEMQKDKP